MERQEAYFDGILDVYAAQMTEVDTSTTPATYENLQLLGKGISVKITPKYREGVRYASNKKVRNKKTLDGYEVEFALDKVRPAMRSKIEGRTRDGNGVELLGVADPGPFAVAFALTLDDGSQELWQLYKGTFEPVSVEGKTAEDKFEYQDHSIKAVFDRRLNDSMLGVVVESTQDGLSPDVVDAWFTTVYEPVVTQGPTSDGNDQSET